jgi:hypothetical protein
MFGGSYMFNLTARVRGTDKQWRSLKKILGRASQNETHNFSLKRTTSLIKKPAEKIPIL